MLHLLVEAVARTNLAAAAAALLVLALRAVVRRGLGARAAYLLWAAVPLAAVAVLLPQPARDTPLSPLVLAAGAAAGWIAPPPRPELASLFAGLWIGGALGAAAMLAERQMRFVRGLGRLTASGPGVLRAERPGVGPAVIGALRPRIVTPADFEARFGPDEREVILAHEAHHLAAGDAAVNALAAAIQCLCWFNPLVHLGAARMRIDQELACDAAVVARFPRARRLYAEALLKTQLTQQALPIGCAWEGHPLKQRIAMLKSPPPSPAVRWAGTTLAAALAVGAGCAAWAAQPRPQLITTPDWMVRPSGADVMRVWPPVWPKASPSGGSALISCRVEGGGRLTGCRVLREDPGGAGLGEAALKLAGMFQMKPVSKTGERTAGGEVRIPFRFKTP
jgi:TonB family protein